MSGQVENAPSRGAEPSTLRILLSAGRLLLIWLVVMAAVDGLLYLHCELAYFDCSPGPSILVVAPFAFGPMVTFVFLMVFLMRSSWSTTFKMCAAVVFAVLASAATVFFGVFWYLCHIC